MSDTPPNQHENGNENPKNDSKIYKIGYRKPPKEWQWKPGECPNTRGRPRRSDT